jgi:hypothetical protein
LLEGACLFVSESIDYCEAAAVIIYDKIGNFPEENSKGKEEQIRRRDKIFVQSVMKVPFVRQPPDLETML